MAQEHDVLQRPDIEMEYARLGKSGLNISRIVLGAMSYGSSKMFDWILDEEQALPLLEHAYKKGINKWIQYFSLLADVYSKGRSEEIIGKALEQYKIPRSNVVIMTKCYFLVDPNCELPIFQIQNTGEFVNRLGLSRKHIFDAVNASVQRLGTYIDVLQIHQSGKVRYIGASSMAAWELQALQNIAARNGGHQLISMQSYHNLLNREGEREMIPYCVDSGVGLIPWSPLARGALTRPLGSRSTVHEQSDRIMKTMIRDTETEADKIIIGRVEELAKKRGISMA
ncbi:CSG1/SUR1-like protein [Ophidiomyces ophidiicola]|nr:CSG1/SUR1-like protein [Ophidiomyces ophidiicola]KAI2007415.1 CSG1/SUR1-like protein [Ophidiomyces ophidiicola]KAI2009819.1 CSG1/SUR1-like protein [Ophidiomyces ophidiicola]KAI2019467.1 CSG1/SUR1-like protein [Ophidiomyces ophidiicola]KAI2036131.1 CSG1/SUR1-like protein [Ophidiomyces ophidiicola]